MTDKKNTPLENTAGEETPVKPDAADVPSGKSADQPQEKAPEQVSSPEPQKVETPDQDSGDTLRVRAVRKEEKPEAGSGNLPNGKVARSDRPRKSEADKKRPFRARKGEKARQETSIFAQKSEAGGENSKPDETKAATAGAAAAPSPPDARETSGDTLRMPSVKYDPAKRPVDRQSTAPPPRRSPAARPSRPGRSRSQRRVADLPRREFTPRHRFGFFSFIFGFIGLIFKMVFVTLLVMAVAGAISFLAIQNFVRTEEVVAPNLKGMKVLDAMKVLSAEDKQLSLIQERTEASGLVSPGEVIDQRPPPGTMVKKGSPIRVAVSSGRANLVVPDVAGETRENAVNKIKGAQLELGNVIYEESDTVEKDIVISQYPEAGKGVDEPVAVDLMVSRGPRGSSLTMPDVTGRTIGEAKAILSQLGFTNIVTDPPNATGSRVVGQEPLVGKIVLQSQRVTLKLDSASSR